MSDRPIALWFDVFGGYNANIPDALRQDRELLELMTAQNVIEDPAGALVTVPGFSRVRATVIASGTNQVTGLFFLRDLANEFVIALGNGKLYRDNANPPGEITGGTALTADDNNHARGDIANGVLVIVTESRDVPQQITAAVARTDLGGTPPRGVDYKYFGRRGFMFSPSDGSTIYRSIASYNSSDDNATAWTNPYTVNFLNFGRPNTEVNVLGGEHYQDRLMTFTEEEVYAIYVTNYADAPFGTQGPIFSEQGGGPVCSNSVVSANDRLYWVSRNFDVKEMYGSAVRSIGDAVRPYLRDSASATRLNEMVGGWEPRYRMVIWCLTPSAGSSNTRALCYQVDRKRFFLRTMTRNAFVNRVVTGDVRLIGGSVGFINNEFDTSTTGDADDPTTAIDADVQTPPLHFGLPGVEKKIPYLGVEFDPVGSESVTCQYDIDDAGSWTGFAESPVSLSGTRYQTVFLDVPQPFERIAIRLRNNTSGQRMRVLRIGIPKPIALRTRRR